MSKHVRLDKLIAVSVKRYGLQLKADWRYEQFFKYLQVSPSYLQAHRIATGRLDRNAVKLAKDFDVVAKTYAAFGNVWNVEFRTWWIKRAQYQFGIAVTPSIRKIASVDVGKEATESDVNKAQAELEQYLLADRLVEAKPASLVMAVPLHGSRKEILKQFTDMLDKEYNAAEHKVGIAQYQVTRNKMRESTLKNAMRVLRAKSALPNKKLYEVGNKAKIAAAYETNDDKRMLNYDKRRLMEILTSRQLHYAYLLAEHAARGKFPCLDKLAEDEARLEFDYILLQRYFKAHMKWLKKEIDRLKGVIATRKTKKVL